MFTNFSASAAELNGVATKSLLYSPSAGSSPFRELLGGDKPPFGATDAIIPRRRIVQDDIAELNFQFSKFVQTSTSKFTYNC